MTIGQQPVSPDPQSCLASGAVIDWQHPAIIAKAAELARGQAGDIGIVRRCYEFVRDEVRHSWDYQLNPVTCRASDVLHHATAIK